VEGVEDNEGIAGQRAVVLLVVVPYLKLSSTATGCVVEWSSSPA
jgi:hypothetical protein